MYAEIPNLKKIIQDFRSKVKNENRKKKDGPCYVIENLYLQPISNIAYTYTVIMSDRTTGVVGVYAGDDLVGIVNHPNACFWQDVTNHYISLNDVATNSGKYEDKSY